VICRKVLLQQLAQRLHHAVARACLGRELVQRKVADELALAVVDDALPADDAGESGGLGTGYFLCLVLAGAGDTEGN
jgi:hypothetical protein